jgi:hypothetical protein
LSEFEVRPSGLFEPTEWRKMKCSRDTATITKGKRKWKAKKRLRVALSTEKPPQIHWTSVLPT